MFVTSGERMNLSEVPFYFLDAQTTGIRPPQGRLIELGWSVGSAGNTDPLSIFSQKFSLPEGHSLSRKVTEITGYAQDDLSDQPSPEDFCESQFRPWLKQVGASHALIHYAQFETPFLKDLLGHLPFQIFCTHQITRRLFPRLPSQNIRAVAGFFGHPMLGPNRSGDFVRATQVIWSGLCAELMRREVKTIDELTAFSGQPLTKKKSGFSYRIPATTRLGLPDRPGIYRMLAKNGEVLYVGKATSLKDRVNSYFRGVKGREKRKLEMLAQAWDLQVEVCGSPLEAALRETDEIKRLNPRYNVSLKKGNRQLCFYSRDLHSLSHKQDPAHPLGPFRPGGYVEMVLALARSVVADEFEQIFFEPLDPHLMKVGFALFLKKHGLDPEKMKTPRTLLAYGSHLFRHYVEPVEDMESDEPTLEDEEDEPELTAEDLAAKFERLLRRAGGELRRARRIARVLNSDVAFRYGEEWIDLKFRTTELNIEAYDRASILLSELSRLEHRIRRN